MSDPVGVNLNVHVRVRPRRAGDVDRPVPYVKGQYPHYEFDNVYDEQASQQDVFNGTVQPLGVLPPCLASPPLSTAPLSAPLMVPLISSRHQPRRFPFSRPLCNPHCAAPAAVDALEQGIESVVLVYGAPGAGKTYTLVGQKGASQGSPTQGLIQNAAAAAFRLIGRLPHENLSLKASYTAITGETAPRTDCAAPPRVPLSRVPYIGPTRPRLVCPPLLPDCRSSPAPLAAGADGGFLLDLLTPGAAPVSVRDTRAPGAAEGTTLFSLESASDISEVLRVGQVALTLAAESQRPAGGPRLDDGAHACLALHLERRSAGGKVSAARICFVELAAPEPRDEGATRASPAGARAKATAFQALRWVDVR